MTKGTKKITKTEEVVATEAKQSVEQTTDKPKRERKEFFGFKRNTRKRITESGFEEKVVGLKRISKTTKGGRHMRFSAFVVVGDKNGRVGYGIGKSTEVPVAIKKAIKNANNNVFKVIMNRKLSIYHELIGRHGASKVLLKPAPEGTGIIAGGAIRAVIELAGFKDIYTKNKGSNTSLNMVRATIDGLIKQRHPSMIAKLRGKTIAEL
jgi:small subunit ribosomal protein S5